ncbi:hypothetical protein DM02DRAFT_654043 [Periconia macrospinosa]|uniref:RING-type domain-containing protein n=1 Tax=Periconia macrospinosa TaxID=97972 RepID=A0A2V1DUX7_9PLEO|nr:hypothetical protein DM02DRAFT_654043 [Periconia macrospinosa]
MSVMNLRNPPDTPLPSLTALAYPFRNNIPTILDLFYNLTGVLVLPVEGSTREQIMEHFHNEYNIMLNKLQDEEELGLYRVLHGDENGTLKRHLGDHIAQPYIVPFDIAINAAPSSAEQAGILVPELGMAFNILCYSHVNWGTTPRLRKRDVFYVLREYVHMGLNIADAHLKLHSIAEWEQLDMDQVSILSAQAAWACTARRLTAVNSDIPDGVKHVLAHSNIAMACWRMFTDFSRIFDTQMYSTILGQYPSVVRFLVYKTIVQCAMDPVIDTAGQIRNVVDESFDGVWQLSDPREFPAYYRPFGFPYEMESLDEMYARGEMDIQQASQTQDEPDRPQNAAEAFAGELTLVDFRIEATGALIDPFSVSTRVLDGSGECPICCEDFGNQGEDPCLELECQHRFHASCLDSHLNAAMMNRFVTCPLCRYEICRAREYRVVEEE